MRQSVFSLSTAALVIGLPLFGASLLEGVEDASQDFSGVDSYPRFYVGAYGGCAVSGDFSSYSSKSNLRIDQLGSEGSLGVLMGLQINPHWRVELNGRQRIGMRSQYFSETVDSFDFAVAYLDSRTITLGAFYDLGRIENAIPYLGAGGGWAHNTLRKCEILSDIELGHVLPMGVGHRDNCCYFFTAGIRFDCVKHVKFDLNYSFFGLGPASSAKIDTGEVISLQNVRIHEVVVGLIFEF